MDQAIAAERGFAPERRNAFRIAYRAYGDATGGLNYQGLPMPTWDDLGDTVLVEVHLSAIGRGSGVPVDVVNWNVFEVLDGRLTSGTAYTSNEKALKAVGLDE